MGEDGKRLCARPERAQRVRKESTTDDTDNTDGKKRTFSVSGKGSRPPPAFDISIRAIRAIRGAFFPDALSRKRQIKSGALLKQLVDGGRELGFGNLCAAERG